MERVTFTRDELIQVLRSQLVAGTLEMLESQGGCPEGLADAIFGALSQR